MEQKILKPNADKLLFTITIDVRENCALTRVDEKEKTGITYHEIIGALEAQKFHMMSLQREHNLKELAPKESGEDKTVPNH